MAETLTGTIIESEDGAFVFETDTGERIVFRLDDASGVAPHDIEGIVGGPVRLEITIDGPHDDARAIRLGPTYQPHP